jgi:radical SAM superfamily enzyme YgiQ (UPF0313 family)
MKAERKKILLCGVFGPFGVDDAWGRKENIMELFHNQVTKAQGVASFRYHHRSFGLYFIAENVDADVTVLDFPSRRRFAKEVAKGYDIVGISFIAPNFVKAKEMARITRLQSPNSVIVLGGHGAAIEGVDELIECDHVVRGEGIAWFRRFLHQDPEAPFAHPTLPALERQQIMGVPVPEPPPALLVPGVGCVNGCNFCSTSHFFNKSYTPFLKTGKEIFDTCVRMSSELGTEEFFVMDENFLKHRDRALELLGEMERNKRFFTFQVFSSAEAIRAFGVDNMVRLGVMFVWIGVESGSAKGNFEKNRGVDAAKLIKELQARGIIVLASGILCQEHHTQDNIQEDIDFLVGLEADFVQFMLLTPLPVTSLYKSQAQRGLLRRDLPFEEWHGQKHLSYVNSAFPDDTAEKWVRAAFEQDYAANSSSMYRVVNTTFNGYRWLVGTERDVCLEARMGQLERRLRVWSYMLPALMRVPANALEKRRVERLDREIGEVLPGTTVGRVFRVATPALALAWRLRLRLFGDMIQPRTIVTQYRDRKARFALPSGSVAARSNASRFGDDMAPSIVDSVPVCPERLATIRGNHAQRLHP